MRSQVLVHSQAPGLVRSRVLVRRPLAQGQELAAVRTRLEVPAGGSRVLVGSQVPAGSWQAQPAGSQRAWLGAPPEMLAARSQWVLSVGQTAVLVRLPQGCTLAVVLAVVLTRTPGRHCRWEVPLLAV